MLASFSSFSAIIWSCSRLWLLSISSLLTVLALRAIYLPLPPILFMAFPTKPNPNFMIGLACLDTCLTCLIELLGETWDVALILTEDLGACILKLVWTELLEIPVGCLAAIAYAFWYFLTELMEIELWRLPNLCWSWGTGLTAAVFKLLWDRVTCWLLGKALNLDVLATVKSCWLFCWTSSLRPCAWIFYFILIYFDY